MRVSLSGMQCMQAWACWAGHAGAHLRAGGGPVERRHRALHPAGRCASVLHIPPGTRLGSRSDVYVGAGNATALDHSLEMKCIASVWRLCRSTEECLRCLAGAALSAAAVLYRAACAGYPPFYDENEPALFAKIRSGFYAFDDPVWDLVSDGCAPAGPGAHHMCCAHAFRGLHTVAGRAREPTELARGLPWTPERACCSFLAIHQ